MLKSSLLDLSDLHMTAIQQAIARATAFIHENKYRSAYQELCIARPYLQVQPESQIEEEPPGNLAGSSSHLAPTPLLPTKNSFIHFTGTEAPAAIDLRRSSTVPSKVPRPWDDSEDISTCGDDDSEAGDIGSDDSDGDISPTPHNQQRAQQELPRHAVDSLLSNSDGVDIVDFNAWVSSPWCATEATHAVDVASAWAQQFWPGFSVQVMGIFPVDTEGCSLCVGDCTPIASDSFLDEQAVSRTSNLVDEPTSQIAGHFDTEGRSLCVGDSTPDASHSFLDEQAVSGTSNPVDELTSQSAGQKKPDGGHGGGCCLEFEERAAVLRSMDTSCVKKFALSIGSFTVTLVPKRATLKKGGSSFRASKGLCTAHIKCNSGGEFILSTGLGHAPAHIVVRHDFSRHPVCSIPGNMDLKNAVDESASLFRLTFGFTVV